VWIQHLVGRLKRDDDAWSVPRRRLCDHTGVARLGAF
jgi:hypothetical protein